MLSGGIQKYSEGGNRNTNNVLNPSCCSSLQTQWLGSCAYPSLGLDYLFASVRGWLTPYALCGADVSSQVTWDVQG